MATVETLDPIDIIREKALQLVEVARYYGVVLTIETEPRKPLAMGHYQMVVNARPSRELYARSKA